MFGICTEGGWDVRGYFVTMWHCRSGVLVEPYCWLSVDTSDSWLPGPSLLFDSWSHSFAQILFHSIDIQVTTLVASKKSFQKPWVRLLQSSTPEVSRSEKRHVDLRKISCRQLKQSTILFTASWASQLNLYQPIITNVPTGRSAVIRADVASRETASHRKEISGTNDPENKKYINAPL